MSDEREKSPDEVRRLLDNCKIEMAERDAVDALEPYLTRVMRALQEILDIGDFWISDESCVSDFVDFTEADRREAVAAVYQQLSEKLGVALDREECPYVVDVARKLKVLGNG